MGDTHPLVAVLGPTGSGKSDLALQISCHFDGEIVNCDSMQLYRGFDIGTAKVPIDERHSVPHYLIDACEPDQVFTAGEYVRAARPILTDMANRRKLPVIAGGTGFYLRALLEGLFTGPERDEELRADLLKRERRRPGLLSRALRLLDPESARRIHRNDLNKLVRAVEVCVTARNPMTTMFATGREPLEGFRVLKIGLDPPRAELYARLDRRCEQIWHRGLADEVRRLLASGVSPAAKPFESIGYKQALNFALGRIDEAESLEDMRRATRRYAKRQMTWFRRERNVLWFQGFGSDLAVQCPALDAVNTHLRVV